MSQTDLEEEVILRQNIPEEPEAQLPAVQQAQPGGEGQGRRARAEWSHGGDQEGSAFFDSATMDFMLRIATLMAKATLIPDSLWSVKVGNEKKELPFQAVVANCFLIVNQARLWNVDAFALAQSASVVHGKVVFEGKVIAAVLESTRGIRLRYEWNDVAGDGFGITATERDLLEGEPVRRHVSGTVGQWATKKKGGGRSDNWMPGQARQQLAYRAAREWCRLHEPGLILGVLAGDDGEAVADRVANEAAPKVEAPTMSAGFKATPSSSARQKARKTKLHNAAETPEDETAPQTLQDAPGEGSGSGAPKPPEEAAPPVVAKPSEPAGPIESFLDLQLPSCQSWADIRAALVVMGGSPVWKAMMRDNPARVREVMGKAWHRVRAIMAATKGQIDVDLREDQLALRCWLETQTGVDAVNLTFDGFKAGEAWKAMKPAERESLAGRVAFIIREIEFKAEDN